MEDFEYSVEICDRDWECFFEECEECNLLPPSLAGVDDSGMSDIDEKGSILAKRVQKVDLTAGFSEADSPIDGPPDCEGSPVEHYLSKHAVSGIESVLSGSEEDIHLQSVNIFFERLKSLTGAEKLSEPNQVKDGKTREAIREDEQHCSDGKQASSSYLPKNIPKLNSLTANGEAAVGKETAKPVNTISYKNTMKKDALGSDISPEPAASNLVLKTNKSAYLETRLFIREEACTETRVNEATRLNPSHDSPEGVVYAETTPHTDKLIAVETCRPLDRVKQEDFLTGQLTLSQNCSTDSSSNQEMVTHVKRKEIQNSDVLQLDATRTNKTASQQSSPSASIKRKRRKKRRLSVEPAESVHGYERQVLVKQSDSEEERYAWRGGMGLCLSEDVHLAYLSNTQKDVMSSLPTYSAPGNVPVKLSAKEIKVNRLPHYSPPCGRQYQYLPESIVRKVRCKEMGSTNNNATNDRSVNSLSQTDGMALYSGNVATYLQPYSKVHEEALTGLPVSVTDCGTGKSDLATKMPIGGEKGSHAGLRQSAKMNNSIICCDEQKSEPCAAEVKSMCILPSAKSNDPSVEVGQQDKLSAAKSVLAVEAGYSGRGTHTLCHRAAKPQQQLEVDCQDAHQYRSTLEKAYIPQSASSSDAHNTKHKQSKTRASPFLEEVSSQVDCAKLTSEACNALRLCPTKSPSSEGLNIEARQTEHPLGLQTFSKLHVLPKNNTTDGGTELAEKQVMAFQSGNPLQSREMNRMDKSQGETKLSPSDVLVMSPSDITPVSSCCTLDTESVRSLSNENITSSCLSVNQNNTGDQGEKTSLILAKCEEGNGTSEPKSQSSSNDPTDSKCDLVVKEEDLITASKAECEPEKAPGSNIFAMSSFWSEMEKVTINDILGLRMIGKAAPPSSLPLLQESNETDMFGVTESAYFTQLDESKPEQTNEEAPSKPNSVESSSGSVIAVDSSSSRGVMWESPEVDIYPENMMLTSAGDISLPVHPEAPQKCLRKISKNVSMHNLHGLESESLRYRTKGKGLQTIDEGDSHKIEYLTDGHMPKQDVDSYRISLTDIFQYLFSGKQSSPSQSVPDNITNCYADGNSVPESYDHFFSEFDTESFFYPLFNAEDQTKDEPVPTFSNSRLANRNMQFPEAYDHFFPSSSSDESSVESDDEDTRGPVRVVSRFSPASSPAQISTDIYEDFFTDSDIGQSFFWKTILSFRNFSLTAPTVQKQTLSNSLSCVPVRQSGRSFGRTVHPRSALKVQDMFQQPFRNEDSQMTVSNPRLDASLLPLRQSEMCLVCIACASWVLKTANPQVGDTWKAVLLANVSALSAIRYLRKYVRLEAAASGKKLKDTEPCDS